MNSNLRLKVQDSTVRCTCGSESFQTGHNPGDFICNDCGAVYFGVVKSSCNTDQQTPPDEGPPLKKERKAWKLF